MLILNSLLRIRFQALLLPSVRLKEIGLVRGFVHDKSDYMKQDQIRGEMDITS